MHLVLARSRLTRQSEVKPCLYIAAKRGEDPFLLRARTCPCFECISGVILVVRFLQDEMIPPVMMKKLHQAATKAADRTYVEFPTGMHMDTWLRGRESYWRALQDFLDVTCNSDRRIR